MEKKYAVYSVEEFRKRSQTTTETELKQSGYHDSMGISGRLILSIEDALTPDWDDNFLITIEKLPAKVGHISHNYKDLIEDRKKKDQNPITPGTGRKFR